MKLAAVLCCLALIILMNCTHSPDKIDEQILPETETITGKPESTPGIVKDIITDEGNTPVTEERLPHVPAPGINPEAVEEQTGETDLEIRNPGTGNEFNAENLPVPENREETDDFNPGETETILTPAVGVEDEPRKIKPVNIHKALSRIRRYFKAPEYPVISKGQLLYITHDLNADGIPEIMVPGIETESPEYADFDFISNFSRLYDTDKAEIPFNLYLFTMGVEEYRLLQKTNLGSHQVFKSFIKFYGSPAEKNPVIIAFTFQTSEGTRHKWVIFKQPILNPGFILEFSETILKKAVIEDIDDDGLLDVIIHEKSIEEGMGYETYLTWLKWNGNRFKEHGHTNIVRNLNLFLQNIRQLLIKGDTGALLRLAIDPVILDDFTARAQPLEEVLGELFGTASVNDPEMLGVIKDVVLPNIMDNPFFLNDEQGYFFPLTYRIVYQDEISIISETLLYMKKNPFGERQFTFLPRGLNRDF